ncbi:replication initiation factor domain-containing protein [Lysobacter niabensis]|uniref:replication initiation factor domain-containing protein n=1 Tax=Agrilutibacter niabensis TaxID=380628 RepID=UPI003615F4B6
MAADGDFSPVTAGQKGGAEGIGPGSNTGQKGGALIDYFTAVFSATHIEDFGLSKLSHLINTLFGFQGEVVCGAIRNKNWQFYPQSAVLMDREGEMVGRVGLGGNSNTICVSLSGAGTRWVRHWERVAIQMERLRGRLSRVDVAFDDYDGQTINVHAMRERACQGEFAQGGRPPAHRFLSDEGHGTGCTLYVGGKGHKELCIYEKGKQLGLSSSPWTRCEVRLYGKHVQLPLDVLTRPLDYLRGSYDVLGDLLRNVFAGMCTRIKTVRKAAEAAGEAMVQWANKQCGAAVGVLIRAFGPSWPEFVENRIARESDPGRFRGIAKGPKLAELLRGELQCPSSP